MRKVVKIRFGYVSTALNLWEASPARTITFTRYKELSSKERTKRLREVCQKNLDATKRMLYYNIAHEIKLYRMSSSIIPLATHKEVEFDYLSEFKNDWEEIGEIVRLHQLRVSFHPNQFTLFTSPKEHITESSVNDMVYHYSMLKAMGIENNSTINIHIGGAYGDKPSALLRFHENIKHLPNTIKQITTLENDDKTYTAIETLQVCQKEKMMMVFDYHHHLANLSDEPLNAFIEPILKTWKGFNWPPKIHISSPKNENEYRSHADYIDPDYIKLFVNELIPLNTDVDFMIEAKAKDRAALQLVEDICKWRGFKRTGEATITY